MHIQCPECNTKFAVPERAIGLEGRNVRCSKCGNTWFAEMPEDAKKEALLSSLEALVGQQEGGKPARKKSTASTAPAGVPEIPSTSISMTQKIATGAMLAAAVITALLAVMPGIAGYSPTEGIALSKVTMLDLPGGAEPAVEISGTIINTASKPMRVPTMRITLADKNGGALQYWEFASDGSMLEPQKTLPFSTGDLEIRFSNGHHFVIDLGNALELTLRSTYTVAEK